MTAELEQLLEGEDQVETGLDETLSYDEYLDEVTENPEIERNSSQRLMDTFEYFGHELDESRDVVKYNIFTKDPLNDGEEVFFGENIHGTEGEESQGIDSLADKIYNAAHGISSHKRLPLLLGPVGGGKTAVSKKMIEYFEAYTRTEEGRMYTFRWTNLTGDEEEGIPGIASQHPDDDEVLEPHQESPLLLLPESTREDILEEANENLDAPYEVDLDNRGLTRESLFYRDELIKQYLEDCAEDEYEALQKVIENHVQVERLVADESRGLAVATFEAKDEKNQDISDLVGGLDLSRVGVYGENDPRSFDYGGAINNANRGLLSVEEVLKLPGDFFKSLLEIIENRTISPKKQPLMNVDVFPWGRTNLAEYKEKQDTEELKAFNSRMNRIDVPYVLAYEDEAKIYQQMFDNSPYSEMVNLEPHTLQIASMLAVGTRIEEPSGGGPVQNLVHKVKAYNGDLDDIDIEKLEQEAARRSEFGEGMSGVTTRYIEDQLANAIRDSLKAGEDHVTPLKLMGFLENNLKENASILEEDHEEIKDLVADIREQEYKPRAVRDVANAMAFRDDEMESLADKYLRHVVASRRDRKVEGDLGEETNPDEQFMREVEASGGIRDDNKDDFRKQITEWVSGRAMEGVDVNPLENDELRSAIERKIWNDKKNNINYTALVNESESLDDDTRSSTIEALKERGYSEGGAEEVIRYVGAEVSKEELEELL